MKTKRIIVLSVSALILSLIATALADEGMWLYDNPPDKLLKDRYGFEPNEQWLRCLQRASVRFNSGGSGAFVSANGLVITNHHVGADALQKFSDQQHDYTGRGLCPGARS